MTMTIEEVRESAHESSYLGALARLVGAGDVATDAVRLHGHTAVVIRSRAAEGVGAELAVFSSAELARRAAERAACELRTAGLAVPEGGFRLVQEYSCAGTGRAYSCRFAGAVGL